MERSEMKLGAQLYTVREYMKTQDDFKTAMRKIAAIGYKYVQVSGAADAPAHLIKEMKDETGLGVIITHSPADRILRDTDRLIDEHLSFGAKAIGIGSMGAYSHDRDGYLRFCEDYAPAAEKIKKAGLVFCYHNHRFEFEKYDGKTGIEILLENSDPAALKLTFDTYWAVAGGADPCKFIRGHKDRIFCTHLKDMTVKDDKQTMIEVGDGNMNFPAILDACRESGIEYHFVEQDTVTMNAFDSMKKSFENLTEMYFG